MIHQKTRENILYVASEEWLKYLKFWFLAFIAIFLFLWVRAYVLELETIAGIRAASSLAGFEQVASTAGFQGNIVIPKIGVQAPITFVQSTDPKDFVQPLLHGVAHYPSAVPGQDGTAILLGHSAPFGWLGNKYERVFSHLNSLQKGDMVDITVQKVTYQYTVEGYFYLQGGQSIPQNVMNTGHPQVLLISCWPPGIDSRRIVIETALIK